MLKYSERKLTNTGYTKQIPVDKDMMRYLAELVSQSDSWVQNPVTEIKDMNESKAIYSMYLLHDTDYQNHVMPRIFLLKILLQAQVVSKFE